MNLTEKLRAYMGLTSKADPKAGPSKEDKYDQKFHRILEGVPITTPLGSHMVVDHTYSLSHIHGGIALHEGLNISPEILEIMTKDGGFRHFDFNRAVFIDTETTGLAGGTGTVAFLIGLGYVEKEEFHMRQYFLRDFDEEASALYSIKEQMESFDYLVSFNGRTFDIPLLTTRFRLNRLEDPLEGMLNLDLLFPARRLFKERLKSASLSSLETHLFGLRRVEDIPGYLIPSVYFDYLSHKNPAPLKPIFHHNCLDILSMVTLTARLSKALEDPFCPGNCTGEDYYCLGRIYEEIKDIPKAIRCYTKALEVPEVKVRAYKDLSLIYKRMGNLAKAKELWFEMIRLDLNPGFALVELAKYYEHRAKDYDKALQFTQKALDLALRRKVFSSNPSNNQDIRDLTKRLDRLKKKHQKGERVS
jgi:uncharacterized protein YprB with RNaseH-like and TPR domain